MNARSRKSPQTISKATPSTTSSRASASGVTPCVRLDGQMILPCGLAAAPARVSVQAGKGKALTIDVTYGLHGSGSLESFALTSFLASRYRAKTASLGSTLFRLTWKTRVTPSGRLIPALRASGHRTSGSDCTSWVTPQRKDYRCGQAKRYLAGNHAVSVNDQVMLASWPTPRAQEPGSINRSKSGGPPQALSVYASWAIPTRREQGHQLNLDDAATLAPWPTPVANDDNKSVEAHLAMKARMGGNRKEITSLQVMAKASGLTANGSPASTANRGQLNPYFSLWLQGLPTAWGSCGERVTRSARRKPSRSSKVTSK